MTITYKITPVVAKGTITAYVNKGTSGAEAYRLRVGYGEYAVGTLVQDGLLFGKKLGVGASGWIDIRRGLFTSSGEVDPPPVVLPTGTVTPPTPQNFTVTVNTYMGIYTVLIEGDETAQPINVILNGRPLV